MSHAALLARIADGRTDLVFTAVSAGLPATAAIDGVPLLAHCAYYGDVSAIRFLLANGAALADLGHNLDLNGAAFHGHWRLCEFLLENGADARQPLPDTGETPLHAALCRSDAATEPVLQVLLRHGADPRAATRPGVPTGSFMRDARTRGESPLHRAAVFGAEQSIALLLSHGADREQRDAAGDSALSWASWAGRPAYILAMLCFGGHRIHPDAIAASRRLLPGQTMMQRHLLGRPDAAAQGPDGLPT